MKILKYSKTKTNEYKILTDKGEYKLYDDIIIKYELLLKKELKESELTKIINENKLLEAYYIALKVLSIKMRSEKELGTILKKKDYSNNEIEYALNRLNKENYLNKDIYIEAYIHDRLTLYLEGENKIHKDLLTIGFNEIEITSHLAKIDKEIYLNKITKYITKKAKVNRRSINDFKKRITIDLINKGFNKSDIISVLDTFELSENEQEIKKLINKLYQKYINKYDLNTTKIKIKTFLYQKGYTNIDIDTYLDC